MKLKKKIKLLEAEIKQLKTVVAKDSITLTDEYNQEVKVIISLKDGVFLTEKITTSTKTDIITKDSK